ncbi:DNA polymerase III subunit alpha [Reichenbachiella agarivorans]|uniref:DNA polymerase III subunit alpha n=1 Tax=Reichenbachiella agarivorans TaxID=2979464 RepID=A0ABY6CKH9_9BACT|nr:DNA polymerase III subunit alpha [Reichenbachiella agarivorans]UXP31022.1 DNA polymerase III subunit alpha [Reichenbachiella agarivorans]
MYLIFDTETTGLPKNYNAPLEDLDNWPRLVQLAWQLHASDGSLIRAQNFIVKPDGYTIPFNAQKVHGISTERAEAEGHDLNEVLDIFSADLLKTQSVVGHNVEFDLNIVGAEYLRKERNNDLSTIKAIDTKDESTDYVAIPGRGGKFKWPTLTELHTKLFGTGFADAHDAAYDVDATAKCFFGLITEGIIPPLDGRDRKEVIYEAPKLDAANFAVAEEVTVETPPKGTTADIKAMEDVSFSHLHVHSQFSVLQAVSEVQSIVDTAKAMDMPAIALTDHGNMMAAFHFVRAAHKAEIKPILGCEFNITDDRKSKSKQNNGYQQVLIAKNKAGYHNLAKMASIAFIEGFYYVPRIDKEVLVQYKSDIIATTGGLWGEIPFTILNYGVEQAEEVFIWYKEQFGEDFYVELTRHGVEEENIVNQVLLDFAKKHGVKYFASNNTYYTEKKQANAHDILLCVKDGEQQSKPKMYIGKRGREYRYGFPNDEFYIKSQDEMKKLFADLPEAISTTAEIVEKIESYALERDILLPAYSIPEEFRDERDKDDPKLKLGENNLLRHLTYEGAKKRYPEITPEIEERLDFELEVIRNTGYPGYFLIVQDFCQAARDMGVSVGPGRGSAAGSAVAYCTGITNVDPIKYDLLFERFLNPERVSMPDIDIDFDDEGRQRVIDYVINKYGANQVAQIITYGTMAAKSAIRDTARVLELNLSEADKLAKLVPDIKLKKLFGFSDKELADALKNNAEAITQANELKRILGIGDSSDESKVLNQARVLEGSVRNTGIHACGVIITPDDITKFVPVALAKDSDMYCTQFDNSVVEDAGLLKMDFLGLKTLTLIKDACRLVKQRHGLDLDPDNFPIDDQKTYELFQRGETVGIFQYESPGMQKYMRELKPTVFADLIAMNALYRPGPIEYIPSFIKRKHGDEEIQYDLADMQEYLEETYGITVYQEQVMRLSQKLADFTKGEADVLRKAMGKKQMAVLDKMKPKFIEQASAKGHDAKILEKVWKDWEAFASYAFNKSHSTCYAWVAYQTAYLKANYPAEYMAAVLSNNMNDIKQVSFFMEECQRMGLDVLGPDVNESIMKFNVNEQGQVRFGLAAMKGAGDAAVKALIEEREANGPYSDIFNLATRVNLRQVNKKTFEVMAQAGAFDCFKDYHRRQYLATDDGEANLIEKVIKYANRMEAQASSAQASLFGGDTGVSEPIPTVGNVERFSDLEQLRLEKEVVGLYISGHPLDQFRFEIDNFCNTGLGELNNLAELQKKGPNIRLAGMVTAIAHRQTKNGKPFGTLEIQDYSDTYTFFLFSDDYIKFKEFFEVGWFLYIQGAVKMKWQGPDMEFKINTISLLTDIREEKTKGITLNVRLQDISETFIQDIYALTTAHGGEGILKVNIIDPEDNLKVNLMSRTIKISTDDELLKKLEKYDAIHYDVIV